MTRAQAAAGTAAPQRPRRVVPPSLLVLVGTGLWGTIGTAQALGPETSNPLQVACLRGAFGALALLAVVVVRGRWPATRALLAPDLRRWVLLAALGITGFQGFFFVAVDMIGVAVGTLVAIGSAPVVAGIGDAAGGAPPGRRWLVGTVITIGGTALLLLPGQHTAATVDVSALGVLVAVASGGSYAVYAQAATRVLARGGASLPLITVAFGGAAVLLGPSLIGADLAWATTAPGAAMIAWLFLATVALGYPLFNAGLRHVGAPTATTLGMAEPLVAALLAVFVLRERLAPAGVAGALLVGAGLVLVSLRPTRHHPTRLA